MPDFARISELYPARLARAELEVVRWAWPKGGASLARSLIPAFDERHGDAPEPVKFLARPPRRLINQTVYGFSRDGQVVIERKHAYGALSGELLVTYADDEVEAVHASTATAGQAPAFRANCHSRASMSEWWWEAKAAASTTLAY